LFASNWWFTFREINVLKSVKNFVLIKIVKMFANLFNLVYFFLYFLRDFKIWQNFMQSRFFSITLFCSCFSPELTSCQHQKMQMLLFFELEEVYRMWFSLRFTNIVLQMSEKNEIQNRLSEHRPEGKS